VLPLSVSLNLGYRYYAQHLHEKTGKSIYRDCEYMNRAAALETAADANTCLTATRSCGSASEAANFVELGIL
jgi:hypothetical protein